MDAALIPASIIVAAHIAIALMLLVAGIGKLRRRNDWEGALSAYRLLPDMLVGPVAVALPVIELVVAAGLVAGLVPAMLAGTALMLLFAAAMAINLLRGRRDLDCGCDPSAKPKPIGWMLVLRNLALAALLAAGLLTLPPLPAELWFTAAFAGVVAYLLTSILTLLRGMSPPRPHGAR